MSMKCPNCKSVAHARSSRYVTDSLVERYLQCRNIECGTTFVTNEIYARIISEPSKVGDKVNESIND